MAAVLAVYPFSPTGRGRGRGGGGLRMPGSTVIFAFMLLPSGRPKRHFIHSLSLENQRCIFWEKELNLWKGKGRRAEEEEMESGINCKTSLGLESSLYVSFFSAKDGCIIIIICSKLTWLSYSVYSFTHLAFSANEQPPKSSTSLLMKQSLWRLQSYTTNKKKKKKKSAQLFIRFRQFLW